MFVCSEKCGSDSVIQTKGGFVEKLDAKSLEVFNAACAKPSSEQGMFFLNAFWDEYGDQAEFIYAVGNTTFRLAGSLLLHWLSWFIIGTSTDMKAKGVSFVHLYQEGKDLDFDMGIYLFEQV